ncbi:MAG: hypothetical protein ACJAQT_004312 [Akkermansiaceae bacterium]|jgi:hypothetical protein
MGICVRLIKQSKPSHPKALILIGNPSETLSPCYRLQEAP